MTKKETAEKYHIPIEMLDEYESWNLCGALREVMDVWEYDDRDLERLSLIMTLHDIGFTSEDVQVYMKLVLAGSAADSERMRILNEKRNGMLDEIHFKEKQLEILDYLRYKIKREV